MATGLYWFHRFLINPPASPYNRTCWPWAPGCQSWPSWPGGLMVPTAILLIAGCVSVPFFLRASRTAMGLWALALLTLVRLSIYLRDFSYSGNYHYITFLVILAYLFVPKKTITIPLLLSVIYVSSSLLKFNSEWLSGASLINPFFLHGDLLTASLFYGVVLESVGGIFILTPCKEFRRLIVLQFALFHLVSILIIGLYFPMVMIGMLSIFVLLDLTGEFPDFLALVKSRSIPKPALLLVSAVFLGQMVPRALVPDPALSGVPRLSAVTMLDATTVCEGSAMIRNDAGFSHITQLMRKKNARGMCEPVDFLAKVEQICQTEKAVRFTLDSRRSTDDHFVRVLDIPDACSVKYPLSLAELFERGNP